MKFHFLFDIKVLNKPFELASSILKKIDITSIKVLQKVIRVCFSPDKNDGVFH